MKQQNDISQQALEMQDEAQDEKQNHGVCSSLTSNLPFPSAQVSEDQDFGVQENLFIHVNHGTAASSLVEHDEHTTNVATTIAEHHNGKEDQGFGTAALQNGLNFEYGVQLSLWAYEISDTNLTLAEKLEKRKWEDKSARI